MPDDVVPVTVDGRSMDNGIIRVEWDDAGLVRSVHHHSTGREAVAPGAAANLLQLMDDHPEHWDAWDIDEAAFATAVDLTEADRVAVVASGPLRAEVVVARSFGRSHVEQRLRLDAGSGRLEIHHDVDWHEDHKLLKLAFPVDVHAATARHEIQFGHVERPTHANTSWDAARFETCAHTWVDLSEDGFGVALLNDGKYGHDIRGHTMRLSLLRAPTWPDPVADRGRHRFACALFPHAGSATAGGVIAEAHAFNNPLRVRLLDSAGPVSHSVVEVDDPGVVLSAVKLADDGPDTIVRLHEAFGGRRRIRLRVDGAVSARRVDLLEEPVDAEPLDIDDETVTLDLAPFELVTLRLATA